MGRLIDEFEAARNGLLPAREIINQVVSAAAVVKAPPASINPPDDQSGLCYQHTFFCQMRLPYRNPGALTTWTRHQGNRILTIEAGHKSDPVTGNNIPAAVPWGTKARLVLAHIHGEALRQGSREIEVGKTLYTFVKRITRRHANGRELEAFNDQVSNLGGAIINVKSRIDSKTEFRVQIGRCLIITGLEVWAKKHGSKYAWNSHLYLSHEYFESLKQHAVPLNEAALAELSQNAMALDVYAWLAERLHRINPAKPALIPWPELQGQFGDGYQRLDNFKSRFAQVLKRVQQQYERAHIELNSRGMVAHNSAPPISKRLFAVARRLP
jgi:Plasmid encoded RepA protein